MKQKLQKPIASSVKVTVLVNKVEFCKKEKRKKKKNVFSLLKMKTFQPMHYISDDGKQWSLLKFGSRRCFHKWL